MSVHMFTQGETGAAHLQTVHTIMSRGSVGCRLLSTPPMKQLSHNKRVALYCGKGEKGVERC